MSSTAIAIRADQVTFDDLQVKALVHMGVEGATPADLAIFFHQAKRTGLDPFARQIHMIGRNSKNRKTDKWETKFTIQTGIDGYRLIARRASGAAGYSYEDTTWCGPDGVWTDVWTSDTSPAAAKVVVVRGGARFPAVARYKAYVQTKQDGKPNSIWAQRDAEQLEKCAEALALRKAFPQDLSGLYTEDEFHAVDAAPAPAPKARVTAADFTDSVEAEIVPDEEDPAPRTVRRMFTLFHERGFKPDSDPDGRAGRLDYISQAVGRPVQSSKDLTLAEVVVVIRMLQDDGRDPAGTP